MQERTVSEKVSQVMSYYNIKDPLSTSDKKASRSHSKTSTALNAYISSSPTPVENSQMAKKDH